MAYDFEFPAQPCQDKDMYFSCMLKMKEINANPSLKNGSKDDTD